MRIAFGTAAALLIGAAGAAPVSDANTYTLYRNSVTDAAMRLHVATFDAADGTAYNRDNCAQAQQLFQGQPGVKTHFWCEPGRFRVSTQSQEPALSKQFTTGKTEPRTCNPSAAELARPDGGKRVPGDYSCPK